MSYAKRMGLWWSNVILQKELEEKGIFQSNYDKVFVRGTIEKALKFSHKSKKGGTFYCARICTKRKYSNEVDRIHIIISEELVKQGNLCSVLLEGTRVEVAGQLRTRNRMGKDGRIHLDIFLFATFVNTDNICDEERDIDLIFLDGFICKVPKYRKTPLGRLITDLLIAINFDDKTSAYVPCIVWGHEARLAA